MTVPFELNGGLGLQIIFLKDTIELFASLALNFTAATHQGCIYVLSGQRSHSN